MPGDTLLEGLETEAREGGNGLWVGSPADAFFVGVAEAALGSVGR